MKNTIEQLKQDLQEVGYKCNTYKRYTAKTIEREYFHVTHTGAIVESACTKINHLHNKNFIPTYIKDFKFTKQGIYFEPSASKIKGTYIIIIGNGAVYNYQEYSRTLLEQGYEVILHSFRHKGLPFEQKFDIKTPISGLLINAHGNSEDGKHIINFSLEHNNIKTLDILKNLKTTYNSKIAKKFELGIISCNSGVMSKHDIAKIMPNLNELYLSSKENFSTKLKINNNNNNYNYNMVEDAGKYVFGKDLSPTSFFTKKDPATSYMREHNWDYHEVDILGDSH